MRKSGGSKDRIREATREAMAIQHLKLVHYVARRVSRRVGDSIELTDLVSAGTAGLLSSIDHYDAKREIKFSTFATPRIRGAMLDELRRNDTVSRRIRRQQRALKAAEQRLANRLGRAPRHTELAAELGLAPDQLWSLKSAIGGGARVSLSDGDQRAGLERGNAAFALTRSDLEEEMMQAERVQQMQKEMAKLPERERQVLTLSYLEGLKLREIGEVLSLTDSRVSQIRTAALANLRRLMLERADEENIAA